MINYQDSNSGHCGERQRCKPTSQLTTMDITWWLPEISSILWFGWHFHILLKLLITFNASISLA